MEGIKMFWLARLAQSARRHATLLPLVGLLSGLMLSALQASAQNAALIPNTISADVSRSLTVQARRALERHLRPEEFQVFLSVTMNQNPPSAVPYLPGTLAPIAGPDAPPETLAPFIKQVIAEVLIADRHDAAAKAKLKTILIKTLALDEARGDTVTFSSLGLTVERPESEIARQLTRAEAETREAKAQLEALSREREDAKRDLTQAKSDLDRMSRSQVPAGKEAPTPGQPEGVKQPSAERGFWQENTAVFVGAALVLVAFFIGSLAVRGAAGKLSEAVQSIGSGIPVLGEKIGESLAQKPQALLPAADDSRRGGLSRDGGSNDGRSGIVSAALPMEAVGKRVIELHQELIGGFDAETESIVIEHVSYLLDHASTVERAVATMELLGKDKANQCYARLAPDYQQKVFGFLRIGSYSKSKGEVMIEAGEALKSRIFAASFASRAQLSDQVAEKLLLLGVDDHGAVARALDGEALARFFLYLEPEKAVAVCAYLREKDVGRFDKVGMFLVKVPEVEASDHLDKTVLTAVEAQLTKIGTDIQAPYLSYYRRLVESADDELAEALVEQISSANARVERYMRENIVTFGTFFKLHGDIQEEIVVALDNKTLAALVAPLKPELRSVIDAHVEERRKELVVEEIDRLTARGARQLVAAHKAAKQDIVARIHQFKGEAPLSELLAAKVEGLPGATAQAGRQAA